MFKPLKLKTKTRRYKGGGGGNVQTVSSIPDWARPYMENVGRNAESQYAAGNLDNVAGVNPLLERAFGSSANAIGDTANRNFSVLKDQGDRLTGIATSGGYDTKALKDAAITEAGIKTAALGRDYGARGVLGSARQNVQQGAQDAATAAQFAKIDQDAAQTMIQNKLAAEAGLGGNVQTAQGIASGAAKDFTGLGKEARTIEQEQGDAQWQALQRYASTIYGNPSRQSGVSSGGGGK